MKLLSPALLCLALASLAQAQTPTQRIQDAMTPLRDYNAAWIQVFGFEYLGATVSEVQTDLFWSNQTTKTFAEALTLKDRIVNQRLVGDGITLWAYNPQRNEYSASHYGAYSGPQPDNYRSNLLLSLNHSLKGPAAYVGRLTNEVYGGNMALYRSWVPLNREPDVYEGGASYRNPINQQLYTSVVNARDYVVYELGTPIRRVVIFERVWGALPSGIDGWKLRRVVIGEVARLGNKDRVLDLSLTFTGGSVPTTANFAFQPPAGSRSIAGPRPVGG